MWKWLTMGVVALALLAPVAQAGRDITGPADPVQGVPNDGVSTGDDHGWPGNERPNQAIDNQITPSSCTSRVRTSRRASASPRRSARPW